MPHLVTGRKYSAKTRCFTAVIFDPVTEIMSSLPRCNHQTISEIWSKSTMRRLARGATIRIKHGFSCVNVNLVTREILETGSDRSGGYRGNLDQSIVHG